MADIIDLGAWASAQGPGEGSRERLLARLEAVRIQIAQLDQEEPQDMASEAYEAWADRHEALEDLEDDLMELLEQEEA